MDKNRDEVLDASDEALCEKLKDLLELPGLTRGIVARARYTFNLYKGRSRVVETAKLVHKLAGLCEIVSMLAEESGQTGLLNQLTELRKSVLAVASEDA